MPVLADNATAAAELTADNLAARFGPIPLRRIVTNPAPGTATEQDILDHERRTGRCCELIDGILLEKDMSFEAAWIASQIVCLLQNHVAAGRLGYVVGADGVVRLTAVGRMRAPDAAFFSFARMPHGMPRAPIPDLVPNLAVEVLSPGNTRREMEVKLDDYFGSGVELVWFADPRSRTVRVFTARQEERTLAAGDTLDGGTVLPGFAVRVADLFADPVAETPA